MILSFGKIGGWRVLFLMMYIRGCIELNPTRTIELWIGCLDMGESATLVCGWIRLPRKGRDSVSLFEIKGKIRNISLSSVSDSWIWACTANGYFSTHLLRMCMMEIVSKESRVLLIRLVGFH